VSASSQGSSRLGRGLDSLIPTDIDEFAAPSMPKELVKEGARVEDLGINDIVPNPNQPRSNFSDEQLGEFGPVDQGARDCSAVGGCARRRHLPAHCR
jgi:hypothetical protein